MPVEWKGGEGFSEAFGAYLFSRTSWIPFAFQMVQPRFKFGKPVGFISQNLLPSV